MMQLRNLNPLFIDCQTTGMTPHRNHLLEVAWAAGNGPTQQTYVKQPDNQPVPPRITHLTGITTEETMAGLSLAQLQTQMAAMAEDHPYAVIHCAQFEQRFLSHLWENTAGSNELPWKIICTLDIAKRLLPDLPSRSIRAVAGHFGWSVGELKRAKCHIEATKFIWSALLDRLSDAGVMSVADLEQWLSTQKARKRQNTQYLIKSPDRLDLPHQPGVYRFMDQNQNILYIGKATSLHSRVNSYFRGRKSRGSRLMEMLSQAAEIQTEVCANKVHAALLESDLIKTHEPPYNRALRQGKRSVFFTSRDFLERSDQHSCQFPMGPFVREDMLGQLIIMGHGLRDPELIADVFYLPVDPYLVQQALLVLLDESGMAPNDYVSVREFLRLGHKYHFLLQEDGNEEQEGDDGDIELESHSERTFADWTVEDCQRSIAKFLARSSLHLQRCRWLRELWNSQVYWRSRKKDHFSVVGLKNGEVETQQLKTLPSPNHEWRVQPLGTLSLLDFDRLRVFFTEIKILTRKAKHVYLDTPTMGRLDKDRLEQVFSRLELGRSTHL